jgi:uncharacterized secreted protein with C-terminal beta-propeller domain
MKKLVIAPVVAIMLSISFLSSLAVFAQVDTFDDVYQEHINREAIEYLKNNSIVKGYSDGTYKPQHRINRAEFTKIIIESKYSDAEIERCIPENAQPDWSYVFFPDVPKDEWYAKYVCMAKVNNIIGGYPDGTFKPGDKINFAEAGKIIGESLNVQADPTGTQNEWFAGYVKGLENKKAIPTTIQFFDKEITRGEMAEVVWRLKDNREDKITATYAELTDPLPSISSCPALKEKFDQYYSQNSGYRYMMAEEVMMDMDAVSAPQAKTSFFSNEAASGAAADDYSSTNVQVAGVDEADIVKNDGQYIYMVKGGDIRIVGAYPPNEMEVVAEMNFDEENFQAQEMYVDGDQLTVIGNVSYSYYSDEPVQPAPYIMPSHPYRSNQTRVYVFNISDRFEPVQERVVTYDGFYSTSRRIGDNLYMVMNARPDVWIMEDVENGDDLIPLVKDGEEEAEPMVGCQDIRYFPGYHAPRYLIVSSIPLNDPEAEIDREVFLGSSENVYSSRTHLYVASSKVDYERYGDWDWRHDSTNTQVFRFSLQDGDVEFVAKGEVPGTILNQFSMDAYRDHFRIATTKGNIWNEENPSTNNVYVMDNQMQVVGELEDLAPGEKIYSTRFMGDRLYMVTFKKVDPLFVIDMSSPTNPTVLGKLKIPGYSDYLHPYDENHIIGFGKDTEAAAEEEQAARDLNFAWYQGMKMAIFDVSDVKNPEQKFVEIIGDRGTESELLHNHKALLFDKEKNLLAFPVRIQKKIEEGGDTSPRGDYYETEFSGAVVYDIDLENGFSERGRITHYSEEDILKMGDSWPYSYEKNIQRIIYIGDYLYTISQNLVKASTMDEVEEVNAVEIE